MTKLTDISVGRHTTVLELKASDLLRERMLALGLTRGARIEVIRRGPSGDPTVYGIRGTMIALRKEEAELITVLD
ncbi:FeoA family protein [Anaerocolumna xylanovorans]|uniref:Ferrous iron transport protein A n=1 Tax=Anaerocolumna xylanovorans DSM 12503 TaxID=1121345 RepID=A0A1M7Y9F7_9FIRM|nr:FeoA family protein [Anaerocolumna xylanovorans]SHO49158.1 ferrous iron transport protein A [Anaerocolumna xylanovorans DSM 12503]